MRYQIVHFKALMQMSVIACFAVLAAFVFGATVLAADLEKCVALSAMKVENTNILSSTVVPAAESMPEYCRVLGYVRPAINSQFVLIQLK